MIHTIHVYEILLVLLSILVILLISFYFDFKLSSQNARLKINEQYYKSLFEENSEAIFLFDLEGYFEDLNKSVNEIFGYTVEELRTENFKTFILPEDLERTINHFNIAKSGKTTSYETSAIHKDGYRIDVKVKNIPVIVNGTVVGVYGIVNDITNSKLAEEALIEAESKYRSLVEQSGIGVYILQDDRLVYTNPRLMEIMGYSQEEMFNLELRDYVYKEDIPLVTANIEKRKSNAVESIVYQYRAIKKDGTIVNLEIHGSVAIYRGRQALIGTVIDITDRKKSEELTNQMAFNDYITGLPNDNYLNKRLKEMIYERRETAVVLLELERIKTIRDTMGQESTNSLILVASERIKKCLEKHTILTRWQEDKFVILITDKTHEQISRIAETLLEVISQPLENTHYDVYVNPSIGISIFPNDGESTELLLGMANSALQYAKKHGNNSYHFYTNDLDGNSQANLELEMELHRAIEMNELTLHYQPQFHLSTGEFIGNEALIRWNHPKRGMISPLHFIPIAEETGLIVPIGEWVLRTACAQNKAWQMNGHPPMVISVNLSSRQFLQTNIVEVVKRILAETNLEAKYLDLEITESMTMDVNQTIKTLQALKAIGIKISIDDFGTGYSSLSYLKEFPIDRLKIDRSFIQDCHQDSSNATIVKTIISMAHHLNIQVIAEGVETKENLDFLQQNLCDEVQGYLLSKPLPANKLEEQFPDLQRIIRRYGLTSKISHRLWLERELEIAKQDLQETIRKQDGMTLKYKYKDGKLIHTMCDGELIYRLGLSPDQVVGKELAEILPLERAKRKETYYQRAWQGEENVSYEGAENGIFYIANLRPLWRKGKVVEVIASCVDITEHKRVEEALRHTELNYRLIAENTTDIVTVIDKTGIVIYTSPSTERVKGYTPDQLIGSTEISNVYPEDLPHLKNAFIEIISTKTDQLIQYRYIHRNNSLIYLEARVTPVRDKNDEVEYFVVVARDITEQKKAENHLREVEKLSVAGELAASMAHQIRNPLTSIKGFLQLYKDDEIEEKHYDVIEKEFNQLESIIDEFLALSKRQKLLYRPIDIKSILTEIGPLIETEANFKNIKIDFIFEEECLFTLCDGNQLKQVFLNIIINAIESMTSNGELKVLTEKIEDEWLMVRIIDQGCGMTEERVKKLGEPYYSNKEKGTGLGLMTSYKIIHEHQGEININSKINEGTRVEVKLPLVREVT